MVLAKEKAKNSKRIDEIYMLIMELASGNLSYRAPAHEDNDELDAIALGINMLAEELQSTTVSKNYLGRIYRGVVDMLVILNPDNIIQEVNASLCSALQYQEEELIGLSVSTLFARGEGRTMSRIDKELEKKGIAQNIERVFKTKKGKSIPVSLSCSLLYDDRNEVNGIMYVAKDISKIKKTEEDLRQKNEEMNTLIYRASHDLKGPLTSIMGLLNLAKQEMHDIESTRYYISLIEQSTFRLDRILNDFLELGRLTNNTVKSTVVHFESLIEDILRNFEYIPERKEVQINVSVKQKKPYKSKKVLLMAVLQNLIENAIKYRKPSPFQTVVDLEVRETDRAILIAITDNGLGIDKKILPNIFKMFYRGHEESKGNGLGLYIVRTSIDALKGKISVRSKKGEGTTFTVSLPVKD